MSVLAATAWVAVAAGCADGRAVSGRSAVATILDRLARERPRPVEGRLSAGRGYAPYGGGATPADAPLPPDLLPGRPARVLRGASAIVSAVEPPDLHAAGLVSLYRGHPAAAVDALERAAGHEPSADRLSDLAAAYLALAKRDRPWLLLDAIEAADRAVELDPASARAAFNLALALERLFLVHQAEQAWERYLAIEREAAWRADAEGHLEVIRAPTVAERWQTVRPRVLADAAAGDREAVARWGTRFPGQLKSLIEDELFAAWLDAADDAEQEPRALATLQTAAKAVTATSGERIYLEAVDAIERARQEDASTHALLLRGHAALLEGRANRGACETAAPRFEEAARSLSDTKSPMAIAARYEALVCAYQANAEEARIGFEHLSSSIDRSRFPTLGAKIDTMLGLIQATAGDFEAAEASYVRAHAALHDLGDPLAAHLANLIAEASALRNDRDAAWRWRIEALEGTSIAGSLPSRHAQLHELAHDARTSSKLEAHQHVLRELEINAQTMDAPAAHAEAALESVMSELLARKTSDTIGLLEKLGPHIEGLDQSIQERIFVASNLVRGASALDRGMPSLAIEPLQSAVAAMRKSTHLTFLPLALTSLSHAHHLLKDWETREDLLAEAIDRLEEQVERLDDEADRIRFLPLAQHAYDEMIAFQIRQRNDSLRALSYLERARARALRGRFDRKMHENVPGRFSPLSPRRLPPGSTAVAYALLPNNTAAWILSGDELRVEWLDVSRTEIRSQIEKLEAENDLQSDATARLFEYLIEPILQMIAPSSTIYFAPDYELHRLPFAALRHPRRGFLIEEHPVVIVPGFWQTRAAGRHDMADNRTSAPTLIMAPAFDGHRLPHLADLEFAREEALLVQSLVNDAILLLGNEATADRVLDHISSARRVHIASHVTFDQNAPIRSAIVAAHDASGASELRAAELAEMDLRHIELVFLAACSTAPGFPSESREGIAGLARAFLAAGARQVVATLRPIEDAAAAAMAKGFYERLERHGSAEALRRAQIEVLGSADQATLFDWAAYQLYSGSLPLEATSE